MPSNYDKIDYRFNYRGDYEVGSDGDIADTSEDELESLVQEIRDVVKSELKDWEEHFAKGSGLQDYIGEPNSRETAKSIEKRVKNSLTLYDIVKPEDLTVRTIPVGVDSVMILIKVAAIPTENNSLEQATLVVAMVFDMRELGIFYLEPNVSDN